MKMLNEYLNAMKRKSGFSLSNELWDVFDEKIRITKDYFLNKDEKTI